MAEYLIQSESLDAIADAINAKTGGSAAMTPAEMVTEIGSISGGITGWEYSKSTFTPVTNVGAYGNGGYPATEQYIRDLLPSGWSFARVTKLSGEPVAYNFVELRLAEWNAVESYVRYGPSLVPQTMTDKTASYSFILNSNSVYQMEVFKAV